MTYDWDADAKASWAYAVAKARQKLLLTGRAEPVSEDELQQVWTWRTGP